MDKIDLYANADAAILLLMNEDKVTVRITENLDSFQIMEILAAVLDELSVTMMEADALISRVKH